MAGRPRKPDHIKAAQGTLYPSRINNNPIIRQPLSEVPEVPGTVPDEGVDYFRFVCEDMISRKQLVAIYIPEIAMAAFWWAQYVICNREIQESGPIQKTQSGYTAKTGWLNTLESAQKWLNDFSNKFGLNLAASQKLHMSEQKQDNELFD